MRLGIAVLCPPPSTHRPHSSLESSGLGLSFPVSKEAPCSPGVCAATGGRRQGSLQITRSSESQCRRDRAPAQQAHSPPPLRRAHGDSLREDYCLIRSRSLLPRLQRWWPGRAWEERREPACPAPALRLCTRLLRKPSAPPPSAHHAPLRWLRPFPSRDPGGGRACSREGGPLQPDSSLKRSAACFFVRSSREAQEAG